MKGRSHSTGNGAARREGARRPASAPGPATPPAGSTPDVAPEQAGRPEDEAGFHPLLFIPGLLLLAASLAVGLGGTGGALASLAGLAAPLAALGAGLGLAAFLQQGQRRTTQRLAVLDGGMEGLAEGYRLIRTSLADLGTIDVAAKLTQISSGIAPGEIQAALNKLDEKINNLTKATRMFHQPLDELTQGLEEQRSLLERVDQGQREVITTCQTTLGRLEDMSHHLPTRAAQEAAATIAVERRQDLEATTAAIRANLDELRREQEGTAAALKKLLAEGLAGLSGSAPETPGLEEVSRQLQELLQGLEGRLAGSSPAAPPAAPARPAPAAAARPAPGVKAGGPSVLTAIQKLKQMRGS